MTTAETTGKSGLDLAGEIVWRLVRPERLIDYVVLVVGAISVIKLLHSALEFHLTDVLRVILDDYDKALAKAFEPIETTIKELGRYFSWRIEFPPLWKHVFMIVAIYAFRHAGNIAGQAGGADEPGRPKSASFRVLLWCTVAVQIASAAIFCVIAGVTLSVISPDETFLSQAAFVGLLCLAVFGYDLAYVLWHALVLLPGYNALYGGTQTRVQFMARRLPEASWRVGAGFVAGLVLIPALAWLGVERPFILASLAAMLVMGLTWSLTAVQTLQRMPRLYAQHGVDIDSVRLSVSILRPLTAGAVAVLFNLAFV